MLLKDAMFVWTPKRDGWLDRPMSGTVDATTIPEDQELKNHPMSAGACDAAWRETDDLGRRQLLQRYVTQMLHRDHVDEASIMEALGKIEDVNPNIISTAPPDPDDEDWK
jgi:hypothetical protein